MSFARPSLLALSLLLALAAVSSAPAATVTVHATEADFLAASGASGLSLASFDEFPLGTVIADQYAGIHFSSPNSGQPDYVALRVNDSPLAVSEPWTLAGGYVSSGSVKQQMALDFDAAPTAFAFFIVGQASTARLVTVQLDFVDDSSQTLPFPVPPTEVTEALFFGITADVPLERAIVISNAKDGSTFVHLGAIDDVRWGAGDVLPPICVGDPQLVEGVLGVDGTTTDDRAGDTGIFTVALGPGSTNLALTVNPFTPGDGQATFRVEAADLQLEAQGTVLVTDGAGNSCTLCLNFRNVPQGPTFDEILCCADGIAFFVSNDDTTPSGAAVCSTDPLGDGQPPIPPGYEPSPEDDPWPCTVFTIDSPIAGSTEMILKKDGDFDPRLRLLFSRSPDGGLTFPPFEDITDAVEQIDDVIPDPTKITGRKDWSPVKVACAIQAEICNGIDDDGDGLVDEGLPVEDLTIDHDRDGFFLCAESVVQSDCNDQIDTINPAAAEVCNYIDDDCDGVIDDGDPGGGMACAVTDQAGACAAGATECVEGVLECQQTVFPSAEVCDGIDNDCDGVVDNGNPGGGEACGVTDVGECQLGATACVDGGLVCAGNVDPAPETCGDGLDNDCDGSIDENRQPVATCLISPSTLNVTSQSTLFTMSIFSLVDACDAGDPVPLDLAAITTVWISRAGAFALPDPFAQACPDPLLGTLFEPGILENRAGRRLTGNDLNLKFNLEADGNCATQDGSRQELFGLLSDVPDRTIVPICLSSSIDGAAFECCTNAEVRNTGNR